LSGIDIDKIMDLTGVSTLRLNASRENGKYLIDITYEDEEGGEREIQFDNFKEVAEYFENKESDYLIGSKIKITKDNHYNSDRVGWGKSGQGLAPVGHTGKIVDMSDNGVYIEFDCCPAECNERFFLEHGEYQVIGKPSIDEGATILIEGDDVKIIDTPSKVKLDYFKKVKTPSDRELSFLKAGREVGELRKGDIVKLEGFFIDRFHKVYDVYKDTADVGSFYEDISQMSLVTPVDERLDLSDDDK